MNLSDDCYELTILRKFRDEYVRQLPTSKKTISDYYAIAPAIVKRIKATPDGWSRLERLYYDLVLKCVKYIEQKEYEEVLSLYYETVRKLGAV